MRVMTASRAALCITSASLFLGGCQHAAIRGGADVRNEAPAITPGELFEVGLLHARQGDLLRAEQYLSAARNHGYDEPTVVYWLVRVCVAAGRYHSALDHAARYLRDDPANWRLRLVVASIHEALGDFPRARVELEHIVRAQPNLPLPHYRLAMIYSKQASEMDRAASHFNAYLALDPHGRHTAEVEILLTHPGRLIRQPDGESPAVFESEHEEHP